jgi:hypothetical protein
MKDFIIVGRGLAAHVLMHAFAEHNISYTCIGSEQLSNCSRVAAGIWNPIVFKRSTKSWLADALIPSLNVFYGRCEQLFGEQIITQRPIIKPFTENQEQVLWYKKAKHELQEFISEDIFSAVSEDFVHCIVPNKYGLVKQSGNLNVPLFLDLSTAYFKDQIVNDMFDYRRLKISTDKVVYDNVEAKQIIFCEGYRVKDNPFFGWIPLKPAKGEVLTIKAPELKFKNAVFNKNGFLMDVEAGVYLAGATYAWDDLSELPTEKGLLELNQKIKTMIDCDYDVLKHEAGIRPASIDRRPIIGAHPNYKNLFVFNGLGTKGVMLAPYFAKNYVNFYFQKEALNPDVDVKRFYHFYDK